MIRDENQLSLRRGSEWSQESDSNLELSDSLSIRGLNSIFYLEHP